MVMKTTTAAQKSWMKIPDTKGKEQSDKHILLLHSSPDSTADEEEKSQAGMPLIRIINPESQIISPEPYILLPLSHQ